MNLRTVIARMLARDRAGVEPIIKVPTTAGAVAHIADPYLVLGNPIRTLTPASVAAMFEASTRGEMTRIQWVMYHAERTDSDLFALRDRRTSSVVEMDWSAKEMTADTVDQGLAREQAAALHEFYDGIENLSEAIEHLQGAVFRGFAHLAVGKTRLEPLDQWWFLRNGLYGDWYFNPDARETSARFFRDAEPLDPEAWIIREEPHNLLMIAVTKFLRATYGQRWWNDFCERVSRQSTIVVGPENVNPQDRAAFEAAARQISKGASGYLPFSSSVLFGDAERGPIPFEAHMRFLSEKMVLAGTGGKLTMLSEATGIGSGATPAHEEAFDKLARRDARRISELLQKSLDRRVLAEHFPDRPVQAYFEIVANEEPDVGTVIEHVQALAAAGYKVEVEELREKTGYAISEPEPVPDALVSKSDKDPEETEQDEDEVPEDDGDPVANRAGMARVLGVPERWLAPVAGLLNELIAQAEDGSVSDADLLAFLDEASLRVPELFGEMDVDALADVLEAGMASEVLEGARVALSRVRSSFRGFRGKAQGPGVPGYVNHLLRPEEPVGDVGGGRILDRQQVPQGFEGCAPDFLRSA